MTSPSARPEAQRFTTADGFAHAWYELGGDAGPAIILQHGFSANTLSEWVDCGIAAALARNGRRVIGLDALGHGASDKPHEARHYGEARMARDITTLADHLGLESFDLLGYSMGAIVALLVALEDRRLRRLVIGGVGEAVVDLGGVDTRVLDNRVLAEGLRARDVSSYPDLVRNFRAGVLERGGDLLAHAAQADAVHATPMPLERIGVPTLLIAGVDDPLARHPERLVAAIPVGRLALVPGDHVGARLDPAFTHEAIAFLA